MRITKTEIRLPIHISPERYKITLKPDLKEFSFSGEETIYLKLDKESIEVTLHVKDLKISDAWYLHNGKDHLKAVVSYNANKETATFKFPENLPKGKGELKLKFSGILSDKLKGFYRSRYEVNGEERFLATSQLEETHARSVFPCFDEPSQKAIFDVTLHIPSDKTAISNTIETVVAEHESGIKVVEFAPTPKMSTYLLAFIVGEFESIEAKTKNGSLARVFTTPGKKHQAEFALETTVRCLEFYEEYFDIPYPLPVIDMIAIPDFASGAMENWGAVTYRESMLLVDPEHSSTATKQWVALVIAHELAHQWFGNLVTMKWWTHLWLNEGFASYIEFLAVAHLFPEWDTWTQFVSLEHGSALKLDSLKSTHPIEVEVHHPNEITEIFDAVSYSKGASIIRMVADYLGETTFRNGLRHYLKKHAYANAETEDLWLALEEVSKKPVRKIMKDWVIKPGYPKITVLEREDKLTLSQSRFFASPISRKRSKDNTLWQVPVHIRRGSGAQERLLLKGKSIDIKKSKEGEWIKVNAGESSFIRVDYPAKYIHLLKKPIEDKKLDVLDRLGLIRDAFDLAEAGQLPTHEVLNLLQSYTNEDDLTVWMPISQAIGKIEILIYKEPFYPVYREFAQYIFSDIAKKLGWEKRKNEKHTDTLLRSLALSKFGRFGDEETVKTAQGLFVSYFKGQISLDADLRGVVYSLVAETGGEKEYLQLRKLHSKTSLAEEKNRIARALGSFKDRKLLLDTLKFSLSKSVRVQDALIVIGSVWRNPEGKYLAWEFVKNNWEKLLGFYGGSYLLGRLVEDIEVFSSEQKVKEIEEFFQKNKAPGAQRTIAQGLETVKSNIDWLKRDKDGIEKFLREWRG
ncbi:M1 family metallopeptidase [Candidatus Daviesbacteria bacterium]|nr:M1 family metallopeptidase [Candidatus Daviesbacteria bacterium]